MSDPAFAKRYRTAYIFLQHELNGHTGQCKSDECKAFGEGFRKAFEMLPKPPPSRKRE